MRHRVTLVDGDTPEGIGDARRAVDASGVDVSWEHVPTPRSAGSDDPDWAALLVSLRSTGVGLKGPLPTRGSGRNGNVELRHALDLYAGVRPCRTLPGIGSRYREVDLVVIRENTEDLYAGLEFDQGSREADELVGFVERATGRALPAEVGISMKANSVRASERIVSFAFRWASDHGRRLVTAGHKANIMKFSDGLFLEAARRVAADHPTIAFEDRIIDALSMQLVQRPETFDVVVLPNLYGDLVSGLCAGIAGGPAAAPGGSFGDACAVFGPVRADDADGSASSAAPMLSAAMMLAHLGERDAAARLDAAVVAALASGETPLVDAVIRRLDAAS